MRNHPTIAILLFLLALCGAERAIAQTWDDPVSVERLASDHWRIRVRVGEPRVYALRGATPHDRVSVPGFETRMIAGAPELPLRSVAFGLPAGGSLRVTVTARDEQRLRRALGGWNAGGAPRRPDLPTAFARATPPTVREGRAEAAVRIEPVLYDAQRGELRWAGSLTIDVRISGAAAGVPGDASRAGVPDHWVNRADAASWPKQSPSAALRRGVPVASAGETRVRIRTPRDGMYRITRDELAAVQPPITGADPRTLRLTCAGDEQPMFVRGEEDGSFDSGDAIEFYAPRRQGTDGEWYDAWSDENVFILSWGAAAGRRLSRENADPDAQPSAPEQGFVPMRLHLEEDRDYHRGDFEYSDMTASETVPGEGWIWGYLLKKDTLVTTFRLASVTGAASRLSVRAKCASRDPSLLRVELNGTVLGEGTLANYKVDTLRFDVPAGLLRQGDNRLVFRSAVVVTCPDDDPTCTIERFYVDWADLRHHGAFTADSAFLAIDPAAETGALPAAYRATARFESGEVRGLNITAGALLDGLRSTPAGAWQDVRGAFRGADAYLLFQEAAIRRDARLDAFTTTSYASAGNAADYVVLTHRDFLAPARRLADLRASGRGWRTVVADVDDLYNEFNEGFKNPEAIKRFLRIAYDTWTQRPRYAVIVGDASWDPKALLSTTEKRDFVPTWGNPASDNWYVAYADSAWDATPAFPIGRIPAETAAAADAVIDKIIEHESAPPQPWSNRMLYSVGGKDRFEQETQLIPVAEGLILNWSLPHCLDVRRVYKRTMDYVSYDDLDTLMHEVNLGVSWFIFAGHGGTRVIDVGVERPEIFDNKGKYFLFLTLSCNTAHFAEPFETGLDERFVLAPDRGAVVAMGTSGLGVMNYDYVMTRGMMRAQLDSGVRGFGDLLLAGKREMIRAFGIGDRYVRNALQQVSLLGDPAVRDQLPPGPELAVRGAGITTDPPIVTEQQRTLVTAQLENYGTCMTDSVDAVFTVSAGGRTLRELRRRVPPFAVSLPVTWEEDFSGMEGEVRLTVAVDAADEVAESQEGNNSATLAVNVLPRGIAQIFPLDNAAIGAADGPVRFTVANPSHLPAGPVTAEVHVAADPGFATGVQELRADAGDVYTRLDWPQNGAAGVRYWRARVVSSDGAGPWSAVRSFTLVSAAVDGDRWLQADAAQFAGSSFTAIAADGGAWRIGRRPLVLETASGGFNNDFRTAILRVDGVDVSTNRRGFNCAVVEPRMGRVTDTANFDTYSGRDIAQKMEEWVRALPDTSVLLVAVLDDANGWPPVCADGTNITPGLRAELRRFGAVLIDSLGFRDSYALIGSRSRPAAVREMHLVLGPVFFKDTIDVLAAEGHITSAAVGPASAWESLAWSGTAGTQGASVRLALLAQGANGQDTLLYRTPPLAPGEVHTPAGLDATRMPRLKLRAELADSSGTGSPHLTGVDLRYRSPFPEIGVTSRTVLSAPDSVLEGVPVGVSVDVHNAGRDRARDVRVTLTVRGREGAAQTVLLPLADTAGVPARALFTIPTTGLRGQVHYDVAVDPAGTVTEYYRANDVFARAFYAAKDGTRPDLSVQFDGMVIANNDEVAPAPLIAVRLRDVSPLPVTDTSAVQMFLDGGRVWLQNNPQVVYRTGAGLEKVSIDFTPVLRTGWHSLAVSGTDASGNKADTLPYQVRFHVSTEDAVDEVYPYPSPTQGAADFTFRVLGSNRPERAKVKIYTVAGRLIREVEADGAELRIGANRIRWDGRDADGDLPANGVYFFKLVVERGGTAQEAVGRIAILR